MKSRIADEMKRVDLDLQIERSIGSAIQHFREEGFTEAERTTTDTMVADQQDYDLPADFSRALNWRITYDSTTQELLVCGVEEMDGWDTNATVPESGRPLYVALWGEGHGNLKYKLWPRPQSATYVVTLRYLSNIASPTSDTEADNFWMTQGEQMIRQYAKGLLFSDVLRQYDKAAEERNLASLEFNRLRARTEGRHYDVDVRPWL
jgi:hypothetical protein